MSLVGRLALLALMLPGSALAGGYELAPQSAAVAGVAHAGAAISEDPAAIWFNPAATADDGGLRALVGITLGGSTVRAEGDGWEGRTANPVSTPPYLYLSYSHAWWSVGATVNLAYAGGVRWPDDWAHRFEILESRPTFLRATAYFAFRVGPAAVSVGPHIDVGSLRIRKATDHVAEEGSAEILLRGGGVGVDASALIRFSPFAQLGLTYRSRTVIPLSGEADFEVPEPFRARFPDQAATSRITLPDRIAVGVSVRPRLPGSGATPLRILTEVSLTLWNVNDELIIDFAEEVTSDTVVTNHWQPTMAVRGGVEGRLHRVVTVRGGLYADGLWGAPAPAETLSPSSPDSTRLGLTVGGTAHLADWLGVDFFYEHVELLPRDSAGDALPASYRGSANLGGVSVSFTIPGKADQPG
jgi:long-subunit fatty acid transport protein